MIFIFGLLFLTYDSTSMFEFIVEEMSSEKYLLQKQNFPKYMKLADFQNGMANVFCKKKKKMVRGNKD